MEQMEHPAPVPPTGGTRPIICWSDYVPTMSLLTLGAGDGNVVRHWVLEGLQDRLRQTREKSIHETRGDCPNGRKVAPDIRRTVARKRALARYTTAPWWAGQLSYWLTVTTSEELRRRKMAYGFPISFSRRWLQYLSSPIPGSLGLSRPGATRQTSAVGPVSSARPNQAPISTLARQCISKRLGGLEWAIGVPGTVSGAVVGNATRGHRRPLLAATV